VSIVKILGETADTVTISRDDWRRLQEQLDDAQDRAAVAERRAHEHRVGKDAARRDYLTGDEAIRLLSGESPVKVWREKRGLSQRALAKTTGIAGSYLAEIEVGRKPGSDDAYRKLAAALRVPAEQLDARLYRSRDPEHRNVVVRLSPVSAGVSPGDRAAWSDSQFFPTMRDALDFVRENWSTLRARSPWVADDTNWPIYNSDELAHEIEG
jgi:transcriptional regulator with XRE-family HTH domain